MRHEGKAIVGTAGQDLRAFQNFQSWDFEAKKRFGLCVLDYVVTSNHIHLLVKKWNLVESAECGSCLISQM